jgi:hypothetical protein
MFPLFNHVQNLAGESPLNFWGLRDRLEGIRSHVERGGRYRVWIGDGIVQVIQQDPDGRIVTISKHSKYVYY